jgi:actin-related protein 5
VKRVHRLVSLVQSKLTKQEVIEKTEAELAAQAEKRKEQGKRLQEMQIKMRADKVIKLSLIIANMFAAIRG